LVVGVREGTLLHLWHWTKGDDAKSAAEFRGHNTQIMTN
jgi:hypothetical protein